MPRPHFLLAAFVLCTPVHAEPTPDFWNARPSTTGLPGEEVRVAKFAPDGQLWVAARWLLWEEGGLGVYDRGSDTWVTYGKAPDGPIPSEFIYDFEFAPDGSVWIASRGGLTRFDGSAWMTYDTSNSPLLHNNIANIAIDSRGHVWINNSGPTTSQAALFEFTGTAWRKFQVGAELPWSPPWNELSNVFVDSQDRVWVSNETQQGLAVYDGATWMLRGATLDRFDHATEDVFGNVWFISNGVGGAGTVWKWNGSTFTGYRVGSTNTLTAIAADDDGSVYMGNWDGQVWRITDQGATRTLFTTTGGAQVFNLAPRDPLSSDVWVGSIVAVRRHRLDGAWLGAFNGYNTGVPDFFIEQIHRGPISGRTYLVSAEAGVSRFDGERWINRGSHNPNLDWPVMADGADACFEDRAGKVWIGTNGVARWDVETQQLEVWDFRSNPELGASIFTDLAQDAAGSLFAFEQTGFIFKFNPGPDSAAWELQPMRIYNPLRIAGADSDGRGRIFASGRFELVRWDGEEWTEIPQPYENFLNDLGGTTCITVGPDDAVWLGCAEGLVRYQDDQWSVFDTGNSPLPASNIRGIAFRDDGLMAITAHNFGPVTPFPSGVCVIDGPITDPVNWTIYRYAETPLPHYQLGGVEFDANGDLWVSTVSMGVSVIRLGSTCAIDFTGDGLVDFADYLEFLNLFDGLDARADLNGDGVIDFADYLEFLNLFDSGC